ncbi:hypothetical protein KAT24_01345 [Candidatus Pacearchaeota archaeon]|nr:hypothetical protein [Candidatus Pacearchaeota archaeon]
MEKFLENLQEAQKTIQIIDHMIYVTFPLIKDKKILTKILTETKNTITNCINSILQYEYLYKRINLYKDAKTNFRIFIQKCCPYYKITQKEIDSIKELFELVEKHKQSTIEFLKNEKIVILSENLKTETITIEKIKEFFNLSKEIMKKTLAIIK